MLPESNVSTREALQKLRAARKQKQTSTKMIKMIESPRSKQAIMNLQYSREDLKKQNYFAAGDSP